MTSPQPPSLLSHDLEPTRRLEPGASSPASPRPRRLSEVDAVNIWIARWLRIRRKDLLARYDCDPRRIYEVWSQARFPAAKAKAWAIFTASYPHLVDRVDTGSHRTLSRGPGEGQLSLFK